MEFAHVSPSDIAKMPEITNSAASQQIDEGHDEPGDNEDHFYQEIVLIVSTKAAAYELYGICICFAIGYCK